MYINMPCNVYIYIYTGCVKKMISSHKLISKQIRVQIYPYLDSMFLNRSKFDIFIVTNTEMPFTGREKAFCVLEYAQSQ